MAESGASFPHIAMVVFALLVFTGGAIAQDIAPTPVMDTGVASALPVSVALTCFAVLVSLFAL